MIKDKKIEIRANDQLMVKICYLCDKYDMNRSELVRYAIEKLDAENGNVTSLMAMCFFNIATITNGIYAYGLTQETLDLLTMEVDILWQFLNYYETPTETTMLCMIL